MERNRLKLIFSTLGASCASETEQLIDNMDDLFVFKSIDSVCSDVNKTVLTCTLEYNTDVNETTCTDSGGQFYDNYMAPRFYRCANINNDTDITDVSLLNYPICVGASCSESEVQSAVDGILLSDLNNGLYGNDNSCDLKPVSTSVAQTSSVNTIFKNYGIMCFAFSMFANLI
jgi:hypothetical protein